MNIDKISFQRLRVPLKTPFKTAVRTVDCLEDLVVTLHTNSGVVGFGSAPSTPLITGETHETIEAVIRSHIFPAINNTDIEAIQTNCHRVQQSIIGNTSAKAAVEIALFDLWAKQLGLPLYKALGGEDPNLTTDYTISVNPLAKMQHDCDLAIAAGYECLKLKIGTHFEEDCQRLSALYQQYSQKAVLRLDVNQGWSAEQTIAALQAFERDNIYFELCEQPVHANDVDGLANIIQQVKTPIMADESCKSFADTQRLLTSNAADIINIKLMKCGGISNAIKIANLTEQYQKTCMIGCMLEGSISVAAAAHFAAAYRNQITLIDLDGPTLGQFDPLVNQALPSSNTPTLFSAAQIILNESPGLGIVEI